MRIASLALALVVTAWFALGVRQAIETSDAGAIVAAGARLSPARAQHAAQLLRSAAFLNPDRQVDVLRARADLGRDRRAVARAILERVVASEPDNLEAWIWLARSSVGDLRGFYAAAFRIRQLVPPVPRR